MSDPRQPTRRLIPWIMVGAYALIVLVAGSSVFSARDARRASARDQLETGLQDSVAAWEEEIQQTLIGWIEVAAQDPGRAGSFQRQMRRRARWFNSLYVWEPGRQVLVRNQKVDIPAQVVFPTEEVVEDREEALSRFCVHRARILHADPRLDPRVVASAYVTGCANEPLAIRMHAASEAAQLLENHGRKSEALDALEVIGVPDELTLAVAADQGIPPFRLTIHRIQQASLLTQTDRSREAMDLLERIGFEITALDAPNAAPLLKYVRWPVIPKLQEAGRHTSAARLSAALARAERRVAAYREIDERILDLAPRSDTSEPPQVVSDQYSETPFLLYYGWEGTRGVAVQLEQDELVEDFLANRSLARFAQWLVVTDGAGRVVGGPRTSEDIAIIVPFRGVLTRLQAGLHEGAIDLLVRDSQWISQLAVVGVCAFLGLAALVVQVRAGRQQNELLRRQREFTTRVTHELKTPLAGIRVMAENLESGAYDDPTEVAEMAGRIVAESDRLTARVQEVLDAARERTIPRPEPFEPEEAVFEALDQWGPRLDAVGVALEADLHPTAEVIGDVGALRDAVGCLLDNALKYRRRDREGARVLLELTQEGRTVRIAVSDNGIGVPRDQREDIFERFVRVEGPNRGLAGGYGLGLAQVAQTARAHGGTARCEDGLDGGARFVMELPATSDPPEEV